MPIELEPKTAAERDAGRILLDIESVRRWAKARSLHVLSEALPSGEFMQLSVLHPRLYEVVHRMFSAGADQSERAADQCDNAAAAIIGADPERFEGFHPLQLENDPRYVVAERAAREYVSNIEDAIHAGELIAHDATGQPIDLPDLLTANRKTTSQPAALARAEAPEAQPETLTTHELNKRGNILDAVLVIAKQNAVDSSDCYSVWAALVSLAEGEKRPSPLVGYSSDGVQYRGKRYEETGVPDVFTCRALCQRMKRERERRERHAETR